MYDKPKLDLIETYLALRPELGRFLTAWFRDASIAEDVLQKMYLKLESTQLAEPVRNVSAFLYKVAENLALDWRKKGVRQQRRDTAWSETSAGTGPGVARAVGSNEPVEPAAEAPDPDAALDAKRKLAAVIAALKDLSPQSRNVFVMHKFKGMTHSEVAKALGIRQKGVEKHMTKALKHLVKYVRGMD